MTTKAESAENIAKRLKDFFNRDRTSIFAGAGVGARMGMVSWKELLQSLGNKLEEHNCAADSTLLNSRLEDGDYLGASAIYRTCKKIPIGVRNQFIAQHFQDANIDYSKIDKLEALVALPNSSIVTTNYDRTIFAARCKFASSPPPMSIEIDDLAMLRGAATSRDFSVIRLHGRAELPSSIILDEHDYEKVKASSDYRDFLYALLRCNSVAFIGFSFVDPAIDSILSLYREQFSPNYPTSHIALLPLTSGGKDLALKLSETNIETIFFSEENDYRDLWHALRLCYDDRRADSMQGVLKLAVKPSGVRDIPPSQIHRFLAFVHARATMPSSRLRSLSDSVSDAIVLSIIAEDPSSLSQRVTIQSQLKDYLKLTDQETDQLLTAVLERLELDGSISRTKNCVQQIGKKTNEADECLTELARGVVARTALIYGLKNSDEVDLTKMSKCIEEILLARAWDLSASYAGGSLEPSDSDVEGIAKRVLIANYPLYKKDEIELLILGLCDTLRSPSRQDAGILAKLARAALAVQMALASPRNSLLNHGALPDTLYFDASVLMPAIVAGHPMHEGYLSAVKRLRAASRAGGGLVSSMIGRQFLDEIISHRRDARNIVRDAGLENEKSLKKFVSYLGAENVNVFVSGYSAFKLRTPSLTFEQYLSAYAPYENESALESYLESKYYIKTIVMDVRDSNSEYNIVLSDLKEAYEDIGRRHLRARKPKDSVLVKHEAQQLVILSKDVIRGARPLFVTADRRLQNAIGYSERIRNLSGRIVSAIGFIGLVDLMVGLKPNSDVVTRLVWGFPKRSAESIARDYLVTQIVNSMDEKLLIPLPELLPKVLEANATEIESIYQNSRNESSAQDVVEFADRLDAEYLKRVQKYVTDRRDYFAD